MNNKHKIFGHKSQDNFSLVILKVPSFIRKRTSSDDV